MFYARNAQEVGVSYKGGATYLLPKGQGALKLTVRVKEAPVILQVTDEYEQFWGSDLTTETLLDLGLESLVFVTPITAWRFRTYESGLATVHFRAYG